MKTSWWRALIIIAALVSTGCASTNEMLGWAADVPFSLTPEQRAEFATRSPIFARPLAGVSFDAGRVCTMCGDFSDTNGIGGRHVDRRVKFDFLPMLQQEVRQSTLFPASAAGGFGLRVSLVEVTHESSVGAAAERKSPLSSGAVLRTRVTLKYELHDGPQSLESWTVTTGASSNSLAASTRLTENIDGALKRNARAFLLKVVADHSPEQGARARQALAALQGEVDNKRIALAYVVYGTAKTVGTTTEVIGDGLAAVAKNSGAISASLNEQAASMDRMNRANNEAMLRAMNDRRSAAVPSSSAKASEAETRPRGDGSAASPSSASARAAATSSTAKSSGSAASSAQDDAARRAEQQQRDAEMTRKREEERKAAEADAKRKADELAAQRAREKAEKEARERAEKEAQQRAEADYLRTLRDGARAMARTCPGGEGKYFAVAALPKVAKKPVECIDVYFRAACPGSASYSRGVGTVFTGGTSCFSNDTVELAPKPNCKVEDVRVEVTEVRTCGG